MSVGAPYPETVDANNMVSVLGPRQGFCRNGELAFLKRNCNYV